MAAKFLEIHPAVLEEFKSAVAWYLERSEAAAFNFVGDVDRAVRLLTEAPQRWPSGQNGTRKFVLTHFPFAVVYRSTQSQIQILAIAHGHRRPGYWKERL